MITFVKPYRVRQVHHLWFFGWWIKGWNIEFEEEPLFYVKNEQLANQIVGALNGAYNLGRSSAAVELMYLKEKTNENY